MKKILLLTILLLLCFTTTALGKTDIDELLDYHKQLQEEYRIAIEQNDTVLQSKLLEEGGIVLQKILDAEPQLEEPNFSVMSTGGTSYYDYFTKSYWITRTDGLSLSIYPINLAWPRGSTDIEYAWQHIRKWHDWNPEWKNTTSMRGQFWCHANRAGSLKTPWNIEPYKSSYNWLTCN